MIGVSEIYGKQFTDGSFQIYLECLKNYTDEEIRMGFNAHVKDTSNGQFFPKPADIVRHIDGTIEDSAYLAWNKIHNANAGYYDTVIFDDPIIHSVISDMGGWIYFCEQRAGLEEREVKFFQKEFLDRYKATKRTGVFNAPQKLVGYFELTNQDEHPELIPAPIVIGQEQRPVRLQQPVKEIESKGVTLPQEVADEITELKKKFKP